MARVKGTVYFDFFFLHPYGKKDKLAAVPRSFSLFFFSSFSSPTPCPLSTPLSPLKRRRDCTFPLLLSRALPLSANLILLPLPSSDPSHSFIFIPFYSSFSSLSFLTHSVSFIPTALSPTLPFHASFVFPLLSFLPHIPLLVQHNATTHRSLQLSPLPPTNSNTQLKLLHVRRSHYP